MVKNYKIFAEDVRYVDTDIFIYPSYLCEKMDEFLKNGSIVRYNYNVNDFSLNVMTEDLNNIKMIFKDEASFQRALSREVEIKTSNKYDHVFKIFITFIDPRMDNKLFIKAISYKIEDGFLQITHIDDGITVKECYNTNTIKYYSVTNYLLV